jgi:hypothetical protein
MQLNRQRLFPRGALSALRPCIEPEFPVGKEERGLSDKAVFTNTFAGRMFWSLRGGNHADQASAGVG